LSRQRLPQRRVELRRECPAVRLGCPAVRLGCLVGRPAERLLGLQCPAGLRVGRLVCRHALECLEPVGRVVGLRCRGPAERLDRLRLDVQWMR